MAIKTGGVDTRHRIMGMKQFHKTLFAEYRGVLDGPSHLLNKMKGLWKYFSLPFGAFEKTMKSIKKSRHPEQYLDRVNRFFDTEARLKP